MEGRARAKESYAPQHVCGESDGVERALHRTLKSEWGAPASRGALLLLAGRARMHVLACCEHVQAP